MSGLQVVYEGRAYRFEPGQTVRIGRSTDNDIVVSDPTVSRQHALISWEQQGWTLRGLGRAGTFVQGAPVTSLLVREPLDLRLASPQGPPLLVEPVTVTPDPQATPYGSPGMAPAPPGDGQGSPYGPGPGVTQGPGTGQGPGYGPGVPYPTAVGQGMAPPAGPAATYGPGPGTAGAAFPGGPPGEMRRPGAPGGMGSRDELATAFQILVPVRSWLSDPGWRQGARLLVIPYALLPLIFLAVFASSTNLTTPGWAYSLYIAPLWAISFWLLIRPGPISRQELAIGGGIIVWVLIWMKIVTGPLDGHFGTPRNFSFFDGLGVGFNEEITKALPVLVAALLLLRLRQVKLDVRMWMFLGTIAGLTFGVREQAIYTPIAIRQAATAGVVNSFRLAVTAQLDFAERVFVDGFQHAIWAGVSAFFIGMAVNYPRRRIQLIAFGISVAAILHALNDWILSATSSLWPWILVQAISLVLFLGYTMSAASIERNVRRTPLFRGESMLLDRFTDAGQPERPPPP